MVDDRPDDIGPSPDLGRAKRPPPTIDLEASEVSSEPRKAGDDTQPEHVSQKPSSQEPSAREPSSPQPSSQERPAAAISAWVVAAVSGAVAASLVIGVGWILGWPAIPATPAAGQINAAVIDDLTARIAGAESKASKAATAAADPASAARIEALEKSLASLRGDVAAARAQSEKLAAIVNDVKATPGGSSSPLDLAAINERIAGIERAARAQSAELAQENAKENAKPADDMLLRRIVAAALLDVQVRIGDPYSAALTAAKSLATNPDALKPLEGFAAKGVPNANALSRELLTLVKTGSHRAHRHGRQRPRCCGRAGYRGGAAQRTGRCPARVEYAGARRPCGGASLARQMRRARRGARRIAKFCRRDHGVARQTGAIGI